MTDTNNGKTDMTIEELLASSNLTDGAAMSLGPQELMAIRFALRSTLLDLVADPPKKLSADNLAERMTDLISVQRKIEKMLTNIVKSCAADIAEKVEGLTPEEVRKIVSEGLSIDLAEEPS
jgi:hypothetical protein